MIDYLFKLAFIIVVSANILICLGLACFKLYVLISNFINKKKRIAWERYITVFESRNDNKVMFNIYDVFLLVLKEISQHDQCIMGDTCYTELLKSDLLTNELLSKIEINYGLFGRIKTCKGDIYKNDGYWTMKKS